MKFLCLGDDDEKKFSALPKAELTALVRNCQAHDEALRRSAHLILAPSLATPQTTSVRPKHGKPWVTDGPYTETKEPVGAADLGEATAVASKHPAAHLREDVGWHIEVRPVDYFVAAAAGGMTTRTGRCPPGSAGLTPGPDRVRHKEMTMRFMGLVKATKDREAGVLPDEKLLAAMVEFNAALAQSGVLLAGHGLQPSSKGGGSAFRARSELSSTARSSKRRSWSPAIGCGK